VKEKRQSLDRNGSSSHSIVREDIHKKTVLTKECVYVQVGFRKWVKERQEEMQNSTGRVGAENFIPGLVVGSAIGWIEDRIIDRTPGR